MDRAFYKGLYPYSGRFFFWVVGKNLGSLVDGPAVTVGSNFEYDLSFPARGNDPVKPGYCTASARPDLFYLKGLISLVPYMK